MAGKKRRSGRQPFEITLACEAAFTRHKLIDEVIRIAQHAKRDADRLKAIEFLAERRWGRPAQSVDLTSGGKPLLLVRDP